MTAETHRFYIPLAELVTETLTRLNDARLNELGEDTDTFIRLPEFPLLDLADHEIGTFAWDNDLEAWYFRPNPNWSTD